jgi:enoyl-CoA hydratase/carnithine racemase
MMFALSHDYRIQQSGKGFMCANEIELGMPIPKPELDLFSHAMAPIDYFDTVLSAKRWDGTEAFRRGLVHATGTEKEMMPAVVTLANRVAHLGKNRANMRTFKRDTKGYVANGLRNYFQESKL